MMFKTLLPLVLASQSPRRRALLTQVGIEFVPAQSDIEEKLSEGESPRQFVLRMAKEKAHCLVSRYPDAWLLAADTIVAIDDEILGKPASPVEAVAMLDRLSGCWHQVFTAYALLSPGARNTFMEVDMAQVRIASLERDFITAYVAQGEPLDKAGAYALQGIGGSVVEALEGCPTTVIGLPMPMLLQTLLECQVIKADRGTGI